jgi:hypothetical protein
VPQRIGDKGMQHMPGDEVWLVVERCASGEQKYYLANLPPNADLKTLAATSKARWICDLLGDNAVRRRRSARPNAQEAAVPRNLFADILEARVRELARPKRIYKTRQALNDISVLSKSHFGRSLSRN